jgi:hypothetical protein
MVVQLNPPDRVRVWVLLKARDPEKTAADIWDTLKDDSCTNWLIVRADVVTGHSDYNIVVPVDANDDVQLNKAINFISAVPGVQVVQQLKVDSHHPTTPHKALSFITVAEADGDDKIETGLRIPKSPAENPWG